MQVSSSSTVSYLPVRTVVHEWIGMHILVCALNLSGLLLDPIAAKFRMRKCWRKGRGAENSKGIKRNRNYNPKSNTSCRTVRISFTLTNRPRIYTILLQRNDHMILRMYTRLLEGSSTKFMINWRFFSSRLSLRRRKKGNLTGTWFSLKVWWSGSLQEDLRKITLSISQCYTSNSGRIK